jgi:hypothetical protein
MIQARNLRNTWHVLFVGIIVSCGIERLSFVDRSGLLIASQHIANAHGTLGH